MLACRAAAYWEALIVGMQGRPAPRPTKHACGSVRLGDENAPAPGVGGRPLLARGKRLTLGHFAREGVVVAVGARAVDVVDQPARLGARRCGCERTPGEGTSHMVGRGPLDALALPL